MPKKKSAASLSLQSLREIAMSLPQTEEGIACAGTSLEKRTIKVGKKAFLFLGQKEAMLKLSSSLPAATTLSARSRSICKVGAHGWVTLAYSGDSLPSLGEVGAWIEESYRNFASSAKPASSVAKKPSGKRAKKAKSK